MIPAEYQFAVNQYSDTERGTAPGRDGTGQDGTELRAGRRTATARGVLYLIYLSQLRPQISGRLPLFCILSAPGARTK